MTDPTHTIARGVYAAIGRCTTCGWSDENYKTAPAATSDHVIETGHDATLEIGFHVKRITVSEMLRLDMEISDG